jgi:hypothetical protein
VVRPVGRASAATAGSRQHRGFALALEFGDLVAQDEDLGVLGAVRAAELLLNFVTNRSSELGDNNHGSVSEMWRPGPRPMGVREV